VTITRALFIIHGKGIVRRSCGYSLNLVRSVSALLAVLERLRDG
jgi:hypothetical protein